MLLPEHQPLPVDGPIHGAQHVVRRAALAQALRDRLGVGTGLVLIPSGEEKVRNRDNLFPFRADSDFWYFTGFPEPESWLLLHLQANGSLESHLFCRPRDPEREIWDGIRVGPEAAPARFAIDHAHDTAELDAVLAPLLAEAEALVLPAARDAELDARLRGWMGVVRAKSRAGIQAPTQIVDLEAFSAPLRCIKDAAELRTMAKAAHISAKAHCAAMQASRPGKAEYHLESVLLSHFRAAGSQSVAYPSIVASGPHSCILHHRAGHRILLPDELVLIDAGCELDGYASDITRTFPANGKFTPAQRDTYQVVLAALDAATDATRPGAMFSAPHEAAVRVLAEGLLDLGLLPEQSVDAVIETGAYRRFYMHRTSHFLGLNVHDVGNTQLALRPGMVLTLEPGLYIRPAADVPPAFWNIGIRIEDDAVVTEHGCHLITRDVPVDPDEIEALMASGDQ